MNSLDHSAQAIQQYDPRERTYLRVVREGAGQHLETVEQNWLGRLLMWLGLTSVCMKKVAKYLAENIDVLCQKVPEEKLTALYGRMQRYDRRHCGKIGVCVQKIHRAINRMAVPELSRPIAKPSLPIDAPPLPVPKPQNVPAPADPAAEPKLQIIITTSPVPAAVPVVPVVSPSQLISLSPGLPQPIVLAKAQLPAESVVEYNKIKTNEKSVAELLKTYSKDDAQFQALMEAMTLSEVAEYAESEKDCFGLSEEFNATAAVPRMVFTHMPVDKLEILINAALRSQWLGFKDDLIYRLGHGILECRPQGEHIPLINHMVNNPAFRSAWLKAWSDIQVGMMSQVHAHLTGRYLSRAVQYSLQRNRFGKLKRFIQKFCDPAGRTANILHDDKVMKAFQFPAKKLIALLLIEKFDVSAWEDMGWLSEVMDDTDGAIELLQKTKGNLVSAHALVDKCNNKAALEVATKAISAQSRYSQKFLDCILTRIAEL